MRRLAGRDRQTDRDRERIEGGGGNADKQTKSGREEGGGDLGVGGNSWILMSSQQQMDTSERKENERTTDMKEGEREREGD